MSPRPAPPASPSWKRAFDLAVAVPALVTLAPLGLVVGASIRLTMGRPVLFRQPRPGLHERTFHLVKFRTMRDATDGQGRPLPDDQRVTRLGRFLRASSLDELPELWNVLRGDMSLVGPRPLLVRYLPYYRPDERLRFTVRPGITGLAQVGGRNELPWDERLGLDVRYVRTLGPWTDLRILARTVGAVLGRRGLRAVNVATAALQDLDVERRDAPWVRREPAPPQGSTP
jgi:lipopolysaccharide/colanic/teichoic acid biosynthesis glycosyltransferase